MNTNDRLHALDAVRAFALLAGIVFHATMSFFLPVPAADSSQSTTLAALFFVLHTFRMATFYLIAGFFARLLLERRGVNGFVKDRAKRIFAPMLVGWAILAPLTLAVILWGILRSYGPQAFTAVRTSMLHPTAYTLPLTHLWFLYYLCMFYLLAFAVRWLFDRLLDRAGRVRGAIDKATRVVLGSYVAPWLFAVPLFAVLGFDDRLVQLFGIPTPDTGLVPQLPALVGFGTAFLIGWFVHRQQELLGQWRKRWPGHLAVAAALTIACLTVLSVKPGATTGWLLDSANWSRAAYAACYLASIWYWTFGIIGAALRFCARESAVRRYLADSSYWLYLAHLPIVFFLQVVFARVPWHWSIKFPLILAIALTVLLTSYHYLVRPTFIGGILNGRKYPRKRESHRVPATALKTKEATT